MWKRSWWRWRQRPQWGVLVLGAWLIATGLMAIFHPNIPYSETILAVTAIAAGVLVCLDR